MKTPGSANHYAGDGRGRRGTSPDSQIYIPSITSDEMLDENAQSRHHPRRRVGVSRKTLGLLGLVVVAVAGAVVAFVVTTGGSSATSASNSSGNSGKSKNGTSTTSGSQGSSSESATFTDIPSTGSGDSTPHGNAKVTSDPSGLSYPLTAFAIGDWGSTDYLNGSCCSRRKGLYNGYDWHAERGVTKLMDLTAKVKKPSVVISHGDNFYWTGIDGDKYRDYRFDLTFEQRHKTESMMDVPWINVMGNHDYGGGSYICMGIEDNQEKLVPCNSAEELVTALNKKFTLQSSYKSPTDNRWVLKDHFYKYTVTAGGVSMDIFNVDMNDAESHGAHETCCQCYSYTSGDDKKCKNIAPGDQNCCNGKLDMYQACVKQFKTWADESLSSLRAELKKSTATWKIVNSHYNPYAHYGPEGAMKWINALKEDGNVHMWIAGHTHGEKHDYASFGTHFIENGAGGGIQSEAASGIPGDFPKTIQNVWTAGGLGGDGGNAYGFFALDASKDWLKVRYITFDDNWVMTKDGSSLADVTKIGGAKEGHCWYVPNDGGKGRAC